MQFQKIKNAIQPVSILTISFMLTMLVVGMIAYTNCEEAKIFMDNWLELEETVSKAA